MWFGAICPDLDQLVDLNKSETLNLFEIDGN